MPTRDGGSALHLGLCGLLRPLRRPALDAALVNQVDPPLAVIKRPRERVKYQPANRSRVDDLFSTHRSTENRIAALEKLCAVSCVTSASRSE
jgi:Zn-dependent protease with chaperone function